MMGSLSRGEQLLLDGVRQKSRLYDFIGEGAVGLTVKTNIKKQNGYLTSGPMFAPSSVFLFQLIRHCTVDLHGLQNTSWHNDHKCLVYTQQR